MSFYRILQEIMNEKELTIPQAARAAGLTDSTVRSMMDRKAQNVTLEVAFRLSQGLGVSLKRLNGEDDVEHIHSNITKNEQNLLNNYNQLNDNGKQKASDYVEDLAGNRKYLKNTDTEERVELSKELA